MAWLTMLWAKTRDSLWFLPGILTFAAIALAVGVTSVERQDAYTWVSWRWWGFGGGVEGARGVLNAIAGGLITVTGVTFSVTIVALQLASSQFTPRVLRNFSADRGNQVVLGVFIATFTYTLLVLRTVGTQTDSGEEFVPRVGVTIAVALVLVSIGCLIYFIDHSARSIQVASILDRVTVRTMTDIDRLFPERIGRGDDVEPVDPRRTDEPSQVVTSSKAGYLQAVDARKLFSLGEKRQLVIAMEPFIGDFILPGTPLVNISPPEAVDESVEASVHAAFVIGPDRTPEQDVEFGIIEISDIAVKALSPGINDPTTAIRCIDRLSQLLLALGSRKPPQIHRTTGGRIHYLARHTSFERAFSLAFDPIRHYGSSNPMVATTLVEALAELMDLLPARHREVLLRQAQAVVHDARKDIPHPECLQRLGAAAKKAGVEGF